MQRFLPTLGATALLALCGVLAGCAAGPDLRVDRDPSVDLKAYKTYAWFDRVSADNGSYGSLVTRHLKLAAEEQLARQGYTYSEQQPDLRVNFVAGVVDRTELRSTTTAGRFYPYRGWSTGMETVNVREGTLVIDLVDARRNALVWRGVAEGRIDADQSKAPGLLAEAAVQQIFTMFPDGRAH